MLKNKHVILLFVFILTHILLDQLSKQYVRATVDYYNTIHLWRPFLLLTKVENSGAFLSLGAGLSSWVHSFFILVVPTVILGGLLFYVITRKSVNTISLFAFSCVIGGGIGNLIDRFLYGSVTDFLVIDVRFARTGIFNFADVSIMLGIGLLVLINFTSKK